MSQSGKKISSFSLKIARRCAILFLIEYKTSLFVGYLSTPPEGTGKLDGAMCFAKGTLVAMEHGYKPIELIENGDIVKAQNVESGELGYQKVKQLFCNKTDKLLKLYIDNQKVYTTNKHPFYIIEKGWINAEFIKPGDRVLTKKGKCILIRKIERIFLKHEIKVYNFEVEHWHTYFVTKLGILVHNDCKFGAEKWHQGSFKSPEESLFKHYQKHGAEVGAQNVEQYLRKAEAFANQLRGARKANISGATPGVIRYYKNGKYIDMVGGKIISFGKQ